MKKKTIAIDMMGSDLGPAELSKSVIRFINDNKDYDVLLFGNQKDLVPIFRDIGQSQVTIIDTSDIVPMEIKPLEFLRMKESSMYQGLLSVKEGRADAFISAGSTGGIVTGATMLLRLIEGSTKAGILTTIPTMQDNPVVFMDVGANNYCLKEDLYSFALMARIYAKNILNINNPSTYLLSNGTEEGKGTDDVVDAYKYFKEKNLENFKGNCEARDVLDGSHNIVITSGFTGNIFLKTVEGTAKTFSSLLKTGFKKSLKTKLGYLFSKPAINYVKNKFDYKKYGGAILLGVNGIVIKAHGNSDEKSFYSALNITKNMVETNLLNKIKEEMSNGKNK